MTDERFRERLPRAVLERIQARVVGMLDREGLAAIVTDDPEDVAYLTGFFHHPCERPVAVLLDADGRATLLVPALEAQHAEEQGAAASIVAYPEYPGITPPFRPLAARVPPRGRVATSTLMTQHRLAMLRTTTGSRELEPSDVVLRARAIKEPEEVALHREGARVTDRMLAAGVALVREAAASGELPTEAELARHVAAVGVGIVEAEHRDVVVGSFTAGGLVYAGANSAIPHGRPSSYRLRPGEPFMLSLGAAVGGRLVEGERTFVLGEPTDEHRRYHDAVRLAQAEGAAAIAPGTTCAESDRRCLGVLRDAGLGEHLRHRQGHGIGIGMHEPPWLEAGDDTVFAPGMIVSNEPGIYIPGHGGYRISDSMLVTERGSEPLTTHPRSLDDCVVAI